MTGASAGEPVRVVGALIRNTGGEVFAHRRTRDRRLFPGSWDIPGGHLECGESSERALAREVEEETGWTLRRIEAEIARWEWEHDGVAHFEVDYLVEVDGDVAAPRLEEGKQDAYAWVGPDTVELMMEGRTDGDRRLRDVVAKAVRTRLTERLRLEPIGPEHAGDLFRLHADPAVAEWHGGAWSMDTARHQAAERGAEWETQGVQKWMAYDRVTGDLVGRGGLSRQHVDGADRLEAGWTVRSALWGRGYATEIGRAGLDFAFDDLDATEVVAFTEPHNIRSRAVMERLGMRDPREILHRGEPFVLYTIDRPGPC